MKAPAAIRRGSLLGPRTERLKNLEKALQLLREALDGYTARELSRLFEAERLLSAELGNPIWEGRNDHD